MKTDAAWSVRMADTVLARWADLPPAWSHEYGVLFKGLFAVWRKTGDSRYFDYVKRHIDAVVDADGAITGYALDHFSLDHLNSGRLLFPLLEKTNDARYQKAIDTLRDQYRHHPRTGDGGFWHNGELKNQMMLDGIYMGAPFYAECGIADNDAAAIDDALRQVMLIVKHNREARTGLFYHGWDEGRTTGWANSETGCSANFWGRATGWYSMAIVDLLELLPANHARRDDLLTTLKGLMEALVHVQDSESGLWWNVLDQGNRQANYLEASGSLMFLYSLGCGITRGYFLAADFRHCLDKGFSGALKHLIREESDGSLSVRQVCKTAGLGGKPGRDGSFAYYNSEPIVDNDFKGIAAFLLAANAWEALT